jgi:hypothetical protein
MKVEFRARKICLVMASLVLDGFELDGANLAFLERRRGGDGLEHPHGLDKVLGVFGQEFVEPLLLRHEESNERVEFHRENLEKNGNVL